MMLDFLQLAYFRLRPADSIESALKQLFPVRQVRRARAAAQRDCDMLTFLVENEGFAAASLLAETAGRLGLPFTSELWVPSASMIKETGYTEDYLASIPAVPQPSVSAPAGWMLVIADPRIIDAAAYEAEGVGVLLGLARDIEAVWRKRRELLRCSSEAPSEEQIIAVVEQLAVDARACGAGEVFIGHPETSRYEFQAGRKRYSGSIGEAVYRGLLQLIAPGQEMRRPVAGPGGREISLALTKNFEHPVIYLSWSEDDEAPDAEAAFDAAGTVPPAPQCAQPELGNTEGATASVSFEPQAGPAPPAAKVLLIDDDERFTGILASILERRGYEVSIQPDGEQAYALLDGGFAANLIICDVHMPRIDGAHFLRLLREHGALIPVMMLTSDEDPLLEAELVQIGADAYVRKQEDLRVLLAWCGALINRQPGAKLLRHAA